MNFKSQTPEEVLESAADGNCVYDFDSGTSGLDDVLTGEGYWAVREELVAFHECETDPFEEGTNRWSLRTVEGWELLEHVERTPENKVLAEKWYKIFDMDRTQIDDWFEG
jgi:hypothetical protein